MNEGRIFLYRYNLLREESEGYAKLVTLLNQFGDSAITDMNYEATVRASLAKPEPKRVIDDKVWKE